MLGTIDNEIAFVKRAVERHGPFYLEHLKTKGFSSDWFLHQWAAVTHAINRIGFGPKVLDLGCGPGWTSIFLAGRGFDVVGADVAPDMLELARENAGRLGLEIDFRLLDMNRPLPFAEEFDSVLIFDALHHCPDETAVLKHCRDVLRPGGRVVLVEPDWFHEFSPGSKKARDEFGTTERGMGYGRMKRAFKRAGFERSARYFQVDATCGSSLMERARALATTVATLTVGFPHRSVIGTAVKP